MRTNLLFFLLLFATSSTFGQIVFEKGYIIDNENHKTDCLVKNYDWKNNPKDIEYKLNEESQLEKASVGNIKEFCIIGVSRFVSANVKIDRSANELDRLSINRNPVWEQKQLFLKVLLDGKASLYYYEDGTLNRFFYSTNDSVPQQLIYKRYIYKVSTIGINNGYQQQLWSDLHCDNLTLNDIQKLNYKKDDLLAFFRKYNTCMGGKEDNSEARATKFGYNLKITPGVNISKLYAINATSHTNVTFNNNFNYSLGLEGEIILPYIKNKWAVVFNPTYQYFKGSMNYNVYNMLTGQSFNNTATINYSSLEFPIGVRYYMFLNNNMKLFLNFLYIPFFSLNLNKDVNMNGSMLDVRTKDSYAVGGGISYKRLSGEVRYYSNRDIVSNYVFWQVYYSRLAFVLGIKLF
jgi:hypothetical protein